MVSLNKYVSHILRKRKQTWLLGYICIFQLDKQTPGGWSKNQAIRGTKWRPGEHLLPSGEVLPNQLKWYDAQIEKMIIMQID